MHERVLVSFLFFLLVINQNPFYIRSLIDTQLVIALVLCVFIVLIFTMKLFRSACDLTLNRTILQIAILVAVYSVATVLSYGVTHELIVAIWQLIVVVLFAVLIKDSGLFLTYIFRFIGAISVFNILLFIAVNIFRLIDLDSIPSFINFNYENQSIFGWYFIRLHAFYQTPSQLAAVSAFLIAICSLYGKNRLVVLLVINGLLSFSGTFYIFLLIFIMFKYFGFLRKINIAYLILVTILVQSMIFSSLIKNDSDFNKYGNIDYGNKILGKQVSSLMRMGFVDHAVKSATDYPLGRAFEDIDVGDSMTTTNLRGMTGFVVGVLNIGGIPLFVLYLIVIVKFDRRVGYSVDSHIYTIIKSCLLFSSVISSEGLWSIFCFVMLYTLYTNRHIFAKSTKRYCAYA